MKVMFVVSEDENIGIEYISSFLKKNGHETHLIFDPRISERYFGNSFLSKIFSVENSNLKKIKKINPDIVAFSVTTSNYQWSINMASKIKETINVPIIFGGFHSSMVPDIVIKNRFVDMVCIGEGEYAFAELLQNWGTEKMYKTKNIWFKKNGKIIKNDIRSLIQNLDSLPFPDKDIFYEKLPGSYKRNTMMITSRGCPFSCTYCGNNAYRKLYAGKGCYVRQRSVDNIIKELAEIKKKHKPKHIFFVDDVFGMNKTWLKEFAKKYSSEINIPYSCNCHFKLFDEESLSMLKSCGCKFMTFGLQSGSERIRKKIFKRHENNSDVERVSEICHRLGINFSMDYIINVPTETEEDIIESLMFYNKMKPNVVNIYGLLYFPKTEIIEIAKNNGILGEDIDKTINNGEFGTYISAVFTSRGRNLHGNYRKYALLFTLIPILPEKVMIKIIRSKRLRNSSSALPLFLVTITKTVVYMRAGFGLLPIWLLKAGFSFAMESLKTKLKK